MTYYLLFFVTSFFALLGNSKYRNLFFVVLIVILTIFAGTRLNIDNDYTMYFKKFRYIENNVKDFLNSENKFEWCMYIFPHFFILFFSNKVQVARFSILLFAVFGVSIKLIAIRKYAQFFFLSVILYTSNLFLMHEMTTIRAGVAAAIFLWSIGDLEDKNYKVFFTKLLLCFFFHSSSIVLIVAWLLLQIKINIRFLYVAIAVSFLSAILKINFLTLLLLDKVFPRVAVYLEMMEWMKEKETNIFSFRLLFALAFVILFAFFYQKLKEIKYFDILFRLHIISICLFFLLSTSAQVFSIRTFELLSVVQILLYPMIIFIFEPKSKFIGWLVIIAFSILQIVYLVDFADIYKPYKSWFLN
ncbi:MAG: hypothetical protein K0R36_1996 [Chryseobacterium sp.]|jgi:hypothetical protein|uniref:EpsG family protein n=1 Tax=Chryseobacterium sp. TaxID=1871047 RepID=UPI00261D413D|nr:EpsG family protein [Chryseobacterium sp.]MDF2553889.1 hypothetical protein [Chryseobacterium sp.]MDF2932665.1 hypothetical protein [Chryseobacterium sp.]